MLSMAYDPEQRRRALGHFLEAHGLEPKALCRAAGLSESALWPFLNNKTHALRDDTYEALAEGAAKMLHKPIEAALLRGQAPSGAEVPVAGKVGAGAEIIPFDHDDLALDYVTAPPGFELGRAYIVSGDSMWPVYEERDLLFVKEREEPARRPTKRPVIVKLREGAIFVKKLLPGTKRGRFHLLSVNPSAKTLDDQSVEWIERIGWILPAD